MQFEPNEKQQRTKYIRVLEKFLTRTISLLKLENFDRNQFIVRTKKNFEDFNKAKKIEIYSDYYTNVQEFINKTMVLLENPSKDFDEEKATLLKDANLLQKEKNKNNYKKDKHKNNKFDDGY